MFSGLELARARAAAGSYNRPRQGMGVHRSPIQQQRPQRRQAPPGSMAEAFEQARAMGHYGGARKKQPTGLGRVLGNPAVKGALRPLEILDYGRRGVISTLDQMFNEEGFDGGEWMENVKDPTYGFGDAVGESGNKWLDRAIGLGGDVAFDPLTYVTFGVGKFAGAAGRASAAGRLLKNTDKAISAQSGTAGRLGVSSIDDVAREALGVGKHGLRFGTRNHNVRIPGTERLARRTSQSTAEIRAAISESALGKQVAKMRSPTRISQQLDVIAGRADGDVDSAIAYVRGVDTHRIAKGKVHADFGRQVKAIEKLPLEERVKMTHMAELGAPGDARQLEDALYDTLQASGATGVNKVKRHVTHVVLPDAADALGKAMPNVKVLDVNVAESSGTAFQRQFVAGGDYVINDVPIHLDTASVAEVNDKVGGALGGIKVLEDDYAKIAAVGLHRTADDVATATALRMLKDDFPDLVKGYQEIKGGWIGSSLNGGTARYVEPLDVSANWSPKADAAFMRAAKAGDIGPNTQKMIEDGYELLDTKLFADGEELLLRSELRKSFQQLKEVADTPAFWKTVDEYTQFFKTYATMSPGFHVRNAMSAIFMNFSDGVAVRHHGQAISMFKKFRKDPAWVNSQPESVREAFGAMLGSNARGSFSQAELGAVGGKWKSNFLTRASREAGEWVEGPVRLAAALDAVERGGDVYEALARVTRLHFDYSQLSSADRMAKRVIPFWTFMSRNLPLQLQQQWLKPKSYAHYESLKRNLDVSEEGDVIPEAWRERGAFMITEGVGLAPDLPFTRLGDEVQKMHDPQRLLADFNPALRVPFETIIAERKMFTGREFFPGENKWLYALTNLLPPAAQVDRLSGGGITAGFGADPSYRQDKQLQSAAGYVGLPLLQLTPDAYDAELRRMAREAEG